MTNGEAWKRTALATGILGIVAAAASILCLFMALSFASTDVERQLWLASLIAAAAAQFVLASVFVISRIRYARSEY